MFVAYLVFYFPFLFPFLTLSFSFGNILSLLVELGMMGLFHYWWSFIWRGFV